MQKNIIRGCSLISSFLDRRGFLSIFALAVFLLLPIREANATKYLYTGAEPNGGYGVYGFFFNGNSINSGFYGASANSSDDMQLIIDTSEMTITFRGDFFNVDQSKVERNDEFIANGELPADFFPDFYDAGVSVYAKQGIQDLTIDEKTGEFYFRGDDSVQHTALDISFVDLNDHSNILYNNKYAFPFASIIRGSNVNPFGMFTEPEFLLNVGGPFFFDLGFALNFDFQGAIGPPSVPTPEPGSLVLLLSAFLSGKILRRRA